MLINVFLSLTSLIKIIKIWNTVKLYNNYKYIILINKFN